MNKLLNGPRMKYQMEKTGNTGMSKTETLIFEKIRIFIFYQMCIFIKYLFNTQYFAGTLLVAKPKKVYLFPKS